MKISGKSSFGSPEGPAPQEGQSFQGSQPVGLDALRKWREGQRSLSECNHLEVAKAMAVEAFVANPEVTAVEFDFLDCGGIPYVWVEDSDGRRDHISDLELANEDDLLAIGEVLVREFREDNSIRFERSELLPKDASSRAAEGGVTGLRGGRSVMPEDLLQAHPVPNDPILKGSEIQAATDLSEDALPGEVRFRAGNRYYETLGEARAVLPSYQGVEYQRMDEVTGERLETLIVREGETIEAARRITQELKDKWLVCQLSIARTEKALGAWRYESGLTAEELGNSGPRETVTSLLGDLAIYCDARGISFGEAVKEAVRAVREEGFNLEEMP